MFLCNILIFTSSKMLLHSIFLNLLQNIEYNIQCNILFKWHKNITYKHWIQYFKLLVHFYFKIKNVTWYI